MVKNKQVVAVALYALHFREKVDGLSQGPAHKWSFEVDLPGVVISYKAVILATGQKSPLITPMPGMSLTERISEVQACGKALKNAKTPDSDDLF